MQRCVLLIVVFLMLVPPLGCSDLSASEETTIDGGGQFTDPGPHTVPIPLGCIGNVNDQVYSLVWELTVNPGPIVGGEAFGAVFRGVVIVDRTLLNLSETLVAGGYTRSNVLDLKATVHVRAGVAPGGTDVVLRPVPVDRTCRYDDNGAEGVGAGPFPQCSKDSDNPDGSNENCTGLGGVPDPNNPCGEFYALEISDDCAPGGLCDNLDQAARDACGSWGFCVSEASEFLVEGAVEGYVANGSGEVLFGWADENTGAEFDETGGSDGIWVQSMPVFEDAAGPNGFRTTAGDEDFAFECTMGVGTTPLERTPDNDLIEFHIQSR
ncbi:MAG: hypothetical protein WBM46_16395 [Polyangiales bacterium]